MKGVGGKCNLSLVSYSHVCSYMHIHTLISISYVPSTRDVQLIQSHFESITEGVSPR